MAAASAGSICIPHTGSVTLVGSMVGCCWPVSTCGSTLRGVAVAGSGGAVKRRRRLALVTTDSEESAIAAAAMMGLSRMLAIG